MRINIYCEGPSEETFINRILAPHFLMQGVYLRAINFRGVSKYAKLKKGLTDICLRDRSAITTTMIDYYGLPGDTPGYKDVSCDNPLDKVRRIEEIVQNDMSGLNNLRFNLITHEYEALLFADPEKFLECNVPEKTVKKLMDIKHDFPTPEHINNSPNTAPSKRILSLWPKYSKVTDGYMVAEAIGLDKISAECKHFDEWVSWMESFAVI